MRLVKGAVRSRENRLPGRVLSLDLDNFTAWPNRYPAASVHDSARRAGGNAADKSRGRNGFGMKTGYGEVCGRLLLPAGPAMIIKNRIETIRRQGRMQRARCGNNRRNGGGEWKVKQMQAAVSVRYAEDKPKSCSLCYFQMPQTGACGLDRCFYLLQETGLENGLESCAGCPYGRARPCIGFCMEKLLAGMRVKKSRKGGDAGAG